MLMKRTRIAVDMASDGVSLSAFLSSAVEGLSRSKARLLAGQGMVLVDGVRAKKGATVRKGQVVDVLGELPIKGWRPMPDPSSKLDVVFESDRFIAVSKPAGVASVPLSPHERGCLANAIAHRYPECVDAGRTRSDAGLLGRLDTGTSGLLLAARSKEAFEELLKAQNRGKIVKYYLAVCLAPRDQAAPPPPQFWGESGDLQGWKTMALPLASSASDDERVILADGRAGFRGRPVKARTDYRILKESEGLALVLARITKGFRHQIRVHLASAGLPLASDPLYGKPHPAVGAAFLLHAWRIETDMEIRGLPPVLSSEPPENWLWKRTIGGWSRSRTRRRRR